MHMFLQQQKITYVNILRHCFSIKHLIKGTKENEEPHQREETSVDPDFYRIIFVQHKNANTWNSQKRSFGIISTSNLTPFHWEEILQIDENLMKPFYKASTCKLQQYKFGYYI